MGVLRPRILIPGEVVDALDSGELRAVLLHELAEGPAVPARHDAQQALGFGAATGAGRRRGGCPSPLPRSTSC